MWDETFKNYPASSGWSKEFYKCQIGSLGMRFYSCINKQLEVRVKISLNLNWYQILISVTIYVNKRCIDTLVPVQMCVHKVWWAWKHKQYKYIGDVCAHVQIYTKTLQTWTQAHAVNAFVRFSVSVVLSVITHRGSEVCEQIPCKTDNSSTVHVDAILGYLERKVSTGLLERSRN